MASTECPICRVAHTVCVPVVHSNGTSGKELLEQLEAAVDAMQEAIRALGQAAPNGRDYYPTNSTQQAIKEHCLRQEKLIEVAADIVQIRDHVMEAVQLRARATRWVTR